MSDLGNELPAPKPPPPNSAHLGRQDSSAPSQYGGPLNQPATSGGTFSYDPGSAPAVPGGGDGSHGSTVVNTAAMKVFATNITNLVDPVSSLQNDVQNVNIRTGSMSVCVNLTNKINHISGSGSSDLRGTTVAVLQNVRDAIEEVAQGVRKMAADFDSTEALNNMTTADYDRYLSGVTTSITSLLNPFKSSGSQPTS
jgi:hypothetical protein